MTVKERLHRLVEELPDREARTAERFLEYLREVSRDRFLEALARAPYDDEPETEEEREAVEEGRKALARGQVISDEELARELESRSESEL